MVQSAERPRHGAWPEIPRRSRLAYRDPDRAGERAFSSAPPGVPPPASLSAPPASPCRLPSDPPTTADPAGPKWSAKVPAQHRLPFSVSYLAERTVEDGSGGSTAARYCWARALSTLAQPRNGMTSCSRKERIAPFARRQEVDCCRAISMRMRPSARINLSVVARSSSRLSSVGSASAASSASVTFAVSAITRSRKSRSIPRRS